MGFSGGSQGKESACNAQDQGSIPGSGRSLGKGKGYPLQYSCLENSMDRGAWRATVQDNSNSTIILKSIAPIRIDQLHDFKEGNAINIMAS